LRLAASGQIVACRVIIFAILGSMFRLSRMTRRDGDASLARQLLVIVPPVIVLSIVALYSLRQDKASVDQDARRNAAVLAPDLARRWGARVETELAALVAAACSADVPDTRPAASVGPPAPPAPLCGLIVSGQIRVPLDYPTVPSPPEWLRNLTPAERRRWQILSTAAASSEPSAIRGAAAALAGAAEPIRLNAEWCVLRAEVGHGVVRDAATSLIALARRAEGVETESGAPLSDLALLLALRHLPAGGPTDADWQELGRHLLDHPSFLTGTLIDEATALAPRNRVAARIAARWMANERALALLRGLRVEDAVRPSEVWLGTGADQWVAFIHPIPSQGTGLRTASQVTLVPRALIAGAFQRAPERNDLPAYATAIVTLAGRSFYAGRPPADSVVPVELASGPGQVALPLAVPADTVATFVGQLLRVAPDAMPFPQPTPGGALRLTGVPGAHHFSLGIRLADPAALYSAYRLRLWMAVGLIVAATLAALGGVASTWRAFERQRRLGEMKSNFVASASHELRAPIGAMRLMTESLERGTVSDPARQQEYFRIISQECRRLSSLVENVLDFSRIDRGRLKYTFEPADVDELAAHTVELMRPFAAERAVTLVLDMGAGRAPAGLRRVDCEALQQALVNLVDNAIKHSPAESEVTVGADADAREVRLFVRDHGPGIPAGQQERIFEPFYRLGSEMRRETQGIGIGLSIAKHIAEAHGGRITVESGTDAGSVFTIVLPIAAETRT
jgi:signal transduction histidine kinase